MDTLLEKFRKQVIASRTGYALFYAILTCIAFSLFSGFSVQGSMIYLSLGFLGGLLMATRFHKDNQYLIKNIESDKHQLTLKYARIFKKGELPQTKEERTEYLEYLKAREKTSDRSLPKEVAALAFLFLMFGLLVSGQGWDILSVLFGLILLYAVYALFNSRKNLQKIRRLKNRLKYS